MSAEELLGGEKKGQRWNQASHREQSGSKVQHKRGPANEIQRGKKKKGIKVFLLHKGHEPGVWQR